MLLAIVYFSYRQTIEAYPKGGGSYTVATENLGDGSGTAGRGGADDRLHSDGGGGHLGGSWRADFGSPSLQPHTLELCLGVLVILTMSTCAGCMTRAWYS